MKLYSTRNRDQLFDLKEAVLKGLPDDNGLYMPDRISRLPDSFLKHLSDYSFPEIAFEVARHLFRDAIPETDLMEIIERSITFPAPLVPLDESTYILELFHGPSLAFKDFGARFMAQLMSYFNRDEAEDLVILVATSGDTGGAVAAGFYQTPGIQVVILYPSGKVSPLQEKQLTTLGHNISALEIDGTFDDCQALVKQAFLDPQLSRSIRLSSANSINIARLVPQSFYYFEAYKQLPDDGRPTVFCVPSGNFGNLTAGLFSARMGLPIDHFIAATNINDIVPHYLHSGEFTPKASVRTISNAMDVGNPSNFARMLDFFQPGLAEQCSTWNNMKRHLSGYAFDDEATRQAMRDIHHRHHYTIDPHGAVGYLALRAFQEDHPNYKGVVLETAHPAKFIEEVEEVLQEKVDIPARLANLAKKKKSAQFMPSSFPVFRQWLLQHH